MPSIGEALRPPIPIAHVAQVRRFDKAALCQDAHRVCNLLISPPRYFDIFQFPSTIYFARGGLVLIIGELAVWTSGELRDRCLSAVFDHHLETPFGYVLPTDPLTLKTQTLPRAGDGLLLLQSL